MKRAFGLWLVAMLSGCGSCNPAPTGRAIAPRRVRKAPVAVEPTLDQFLAVNRTRYLEALRDARTWLDGVRVDPLELRTKGIKGKKKLVEELDAYRRLWMVAGEADKPALMTRIKQVAAITYEERYHDMASISDEWFKQDATSYLRAAVLLERVGLDDTRYRAEIKKIHKRLDGQMERRGPHQQRIFHWYYANFGLEEPFPLADALEKGVIALRIDPATLTASQTYELTHEVYALYEYGDRLDVDPFNDDDKAYLRDTLAVLTDRLIRARDPDLLGEVVECMHYLRFETQPAYLAGVKMLLESQNADGAWGHYPNERKKMGEYVKQGFELHTTLVAIGALSNVFDRPMPVVQKPSLPTP